MSLLRKPEASVEGVSGYKKYPSPIFIHYHTVVLKTSEFSSLSKAETSPSAHFVKRTNTSLQIFLQPNNTSNYLQTCASTFLASLLLASSLLSVLAHRALTTAHANLQRRASTAAIAPRLHRAYRAPALRGCTSAIHMVGAATMGLGIVVRTTSSILPSALFRHKQSESVVA